MKKNESYYYKKISNTIQVMLDYINRRDLEYKIAIYPFGYIGQMVKWILNSTYGIEEDYVFDACISKYNKKVKNLSDYSKEDLKKVLVLVASDELNVYHEIRQNCVKLFDEENIFDIFSKVCQERDVRIETLRLNAERIQELGVKGNVAELGVYKGNFAKEINRYFSDRALYLFDTFEGFLNKKVEMNCDEKFISFTKTDVTNYCKVDHLNWLLNDFSNPKRCIIKKGVFPETTTGIDDTFCFVSIDVDIYVSTKEGLEWFWPKMEVNGMIMVHDYNYGYTTGVKKAVDEFAKKNNIPICLVADSAGSVILIKY